MNSFRARWQKVNPALRYMLLVVGILMGLAFLFPPEEQPLDLSTARYGTTSDKRLYFQNVRSYYYHQDRQSKEPMVIYRLKKRSAALDSVSLPLDIVQNPQQGSAFLQIKPGAAYPAVDSLQICFSDSLQPAWLHEEMSWQEHFRLGGKVYAALENEFAVYLTAQGDTLGRPYARAKNRQNALTVLDDFFNLIQKPST